MVLTLLLLALGSACRTSPACKSGASETNLYEVCDGNTFFPDGACAAESCVDTGLERDIFDVWKRALATAHDLGDSAFDQRIEISDVVLEDGPDYVTWQVEFVFTFSWVRARHRDAILLGSFPLQQAPSIAEIESLVGLEIESFYQLDIASVVPVEQVQSSVCACEPAMAIDWCHIDFDAAGDLRVRAIKRLSDNTTCRDATVVLSTGDLVQCATGPCDLE